MKYILLLFLIILSVSCRKEITSISSNNCRLINEDKENVSEYLFCCGGSDNVLFGHNGGAEFELDNSHNKIDSSIHVSTLKDGKWSSIQNVRFIDK